MAETVSGPLSLVTPRFFFAGFARSEAEIVMMNREGAEIRCLTLHPHRFVQLCRKRDFLRAFSKESNLPVRPPRFAIKIVPRRRDPATRRPIVTDLFGFQNLPPPRIVPFAAQLLVVIDLQHPVALAGADDFGKIEIIKNGAVRREDSSVELFEAIAHVGIGAIFIEDSDEFISDLGEVVIPAGCLFAELMW